MRPPSFYNKMYVLMRNLQPESMPEHLKNAGYLISHGCKYIFKGVYKYDKTNSNPPLVRYHDKISDEI